MYKPNEDMQSLASMAFLPTTKSVHSRVLLLVLQMTRLKAPAHLVTGGSCKVLNLED